ncbi:MAG: putative T7SS-secreted protein [Actinomycetota bacterium]
MGTADAGAVPGDPLAVAALADRLGRVAASLAGPARQLRELPAERYWEGPAAAAFTGWRESLAVRLDQVHRRYAAAAAALARYHPALAEAQQRAQLALQRAEQARAEGRAAQDALAGLAVRLRLEPVPDPAALAEHRRWTVRAGDAAAALTAAQRLLADARALRDDAARRCAAALDTAADDPLRDPPLGRLRRLPVSAADWAAAHLPLRQLAAAAGRVAMVAGVAALALSWVPVVGQVLGAVALVAGVLALVADLTLAVAGEAAWWTAAMDAVGLATFGVGRAARAGGEAAASAHEARHALDRLVARRIAGRPADPGATRVSRHAVRRARRTLQQAERAAAGLLPTPGRLRAAYSVPGLVSAARAEAAAVSRAGRAPRQVLRAVAVDTAAAARRDGVLLSGAAGTPAAVQARVEVTAGAVGLLAGAAGGRPPAGWDTARRLNRGYARVGVRLPARAPLAGPLLGTAA